MTAVIVRNKLFGTNGVRGVANQDMSPDLVLELSRSLGTLMERRGLSTVVIGRDTRVSGEMLKAAAIAGALSTGRRVIDIGIAPTPAVQFYVRDRGDAGIVITASHNPREYNGFKVIAGDGTEFSREDEAKIEEIYFRQDFHTATWNKTGVLLKDNALEGYKNGVLSKVNTDLIRKAGLKVVFDGGCGAGSLVTPFLLQELGCRVLTLNSQIDGTFPDRNPEPTREALTNLARLVRETGADLGIAHDGDADRAAFICENAEFLDEEDLIAIAAKHVLSQKKGGVVVTPVSTSKRLVDVVEEMGGSVIFTPVGSIHVARKMLEVGAIFGGEGNGGLIFPEHQYCRDGAMTAAKILELLADGKTLSELAAEIPEYKNVKTKIPSKNLEATMKQVIEAVEGEEIDRTDGVKIWKKGGWLLIRPSGTEPIIRIFAEAKTQKTAEELLEYGKKLVEEAEQDQKPAGENFYLRGDS